MFHSTKFHSTKVLVAITLLTACVDTSSPGPDLDPARVVGSGNDLPTAIAAAPVLTEAELAEKLNQLRPRRARNGSLRFVSPHLDRPEAAQFILERLRTEGAEDLRAAWIVALSRTRGHYGPALVAMLGTEDSEMVRMAMVAALRRVTDEGIAQQGFRLALNDTSAIVRASAAFNIGRYRYAKNMSAELLTALDDQAPGVQSAAVRALGHYRAQAAFDVITARLQSPDAKLRLEALRALFRIHPERASALQILASLRADPDEKIRRVAEKIATWKPLSTARPKTP
jgi:HEAT repeat protein